MHKIFAASLFLSTVLLPAQTVTNGQGAVLIASNNIATEPAAATDATVSAPARRISTGVMAPKLISNPVVRVALSDFPSENLTTQHVVVGFRVDEKGVPQNVHLVQSVNQAVDARILAAVRDYRFEPAQLDNQNVAMDVRLSVNFEVR
jgi:TonB family protein